MDDPDKVGEYMSVSRECEKCGGDGERLIDWGYGERMYTCIECNGSGIKPESEESDDRKQKV